MGGLKKKTNTRLLERGGNSVQVLHKYYTYMCVCVARDKTIKRPRGREGVGQRERENAREGSEKRRTAGSGQEMPARHAGLKANIWVGEVYEEVDPIVYVQIVCVGWKQGAQGGCAGRGKHTPNH